jgi:hypothetical protein
MENFKSLKINEEGKDLESRTGESHETIQNKIIQSGPEFAKLVKILLSENTNANRDSLIPLAAKYADTPMQFAILLMHMDQKLKQILNDPMMALGAMLYNEEDMTPQRFANLAAKMMAEGKLKEQQL